MSSCLKSVVWGFVFFGVLHVQAKSAPFDRTYQSAMYGLSLKYPSSWEISNDSGNSTEKIQDHLNKTSYVVVLRSKEKPINKFDFYFDLDNETCPSYAKAQKTNLSKKTIKGRNWMIGRSIGSDRSEDDTSFVACTEIKRDFSKFKSRSVVLVIIGFAFIDGDNHATESRPQLEEDALKLIDTVSIK